MEDAYIIKGGRKLQGSVRMSGAKNVALKVIIAALMLDRPITLRNIPRIRDVDELLHLIVSLGVDAKFIDENSVTINAAGLDSNRVDLLHGAKIRVSFMLFAPLLHRFSECYVPNPGGCRIGARPIDRIIEGMTNLGVGIEYNSETGYYYARMSGKPAGTYTFPKETHTGTELLIMLSVLGRGKVILNNTANEPEIDDLIRFFNLSGAKIQKHNKKIIIEGVNALNPPSEFAIMSDRNEAVTYAVLALTTKGKVEITSVDVDSLDTFIAKARQVGAGIEITGKDSLLVSFLKTLQPSRIETEPHPGFMTDWQPNWAVLMTQADRESYIHERVFENRFSYVEELRKLGADIDFTRFPVSNPSEYFFFNFDPKKKYNQAIKIRGPQELHGGALNIADLRAGATLAIAALSAEGESVVNNASIMERGYENFIRKVRSIGGDIEKI